METRKSIKWTLFLQIGNERVYGNKEINFDEVSWAQMDSTGEVESIF